MEKKLLPKTGWTLSFLILVTAVRVFFVLAGAYIVFTGLPFQTGNPMDPRFVFSYPKVVLTGKNNTVWVIDKGQRRISKLGEGNRIEWVVNGSQKGKGKFDKALIIGADADGLLWIVNSIINQDEDTTEREEIFSLRSDGSFGPIIEARDYDKETRADFYNAMTFVQLLDGHIFYFYPLGYGKSELTDIESATGFITKKTLALDCLAYISIIIGPDGSMYLLDNRGDINIADSKGNLSMFSPNPETGPLQLRMPLDMVRSPDGYFHVLDSKNRIIDITSDGKRSPGLLAEDQKISFQALMVSVDGILSGADEYSGNPVKLLDDGSRVIFSKPVYSLYLQIKHWCIWILLVLALISAFTLMVMMYIRFFKRRIPLILKQLLIFIPLMIAAVVAIAILIYSQMYSNMRNQINNNLLLLSQIGARQLDPEKLAALDPTVGLFDDFKSSAEYKYLEKNLNDFVGGNSDSWNASTYAYVYRKYGDNWYVVGPWEYVELYVKDIPEFAQILDDGKYRVIRYDDVYGSWYSGLAPIMDAEGKVIAVLEVTINGLIFDQFNQAFAKELMRSILIILILLIGFFSAFTWFLLLSLKSLKQGATRITEGNYDVEIGIHSRDELEDLGTAFNRMSREIQKQILHVTNLNKANSKFVPSEILHFLGKESILEISLGDHMKGTMSVLFSDIRGFTGISEKMTPDENFRFINEYLCLMGPVIREERGFIDKYIGDAIMAIFPRSSDDALHAAIEMLERLEIMNRGHPEREKIRLGIGIHIGNVMMGIIGEEERYEGTVIADAVNLASRLEGLTKQYGVAVMVTEDTIRSLNHPELFEMRKLDLVRVKGKQKPSEVYEVISPLDIRREYKLATKAQYIEGFELYRREEFSRAGEIFNSLLTRCPEDKAVESLARRCARMKVEGAPAGWDGSIELREK